MTAPPLPSKVTSGPPRFVRKPDNRKAQPVTTQLQSWLPWLGYPTAVLAPVAIIYAVAAFDIPPFVFEHAIVLLVVAVAVPFGLRPAIVAALVSVAGDNLLLREPVWRATITGSRDLLDLVLFAAVAIIVSSLVRRERDARRDAQHAANRERLARQARDRLVAAVTHDLATPLSVLSTTVAFAKRSGLSLQAEWPALIRRLDIACARATSMVRLLADAQALEGEDFELQISEHDLRAVVSPVVEMMDTVSERHPVVLAVPADPVMVRVDADRLRRVVENLINNAIKYSPHGGSVEVSVGVEDGWAVMRVRDHGIGISADALPHIFEHSYRAPDTASMPGLGLGLTIAAQVTARHGGAIDVHSIVGEGTQFTVRLPLAGNINDGYVAQPPRYFEDLSHSASG